MEQEGKIAGALRRFRERSPFCQMLVFWLMGGVATVVDLGVFSLGNYWVFAAYRDVPFRWWLIDYSVDHGGMCAFLSMVVSYAVSQTVNFFVQRKATFGATNNAVKSGVLYAVMIVAVYAFVLWLPTVIGTAIYAWLGAGAGAVAVKLVTQFASFLIQFPINKWVVMRKE